jgi:hypothetical protein
MTLNKLYRSGIISLITILAVVLILICTIFIFPKAILLIHVLGIGIAICALCILINAGLFLFKQIITTASQKHTHNEENNKSNKF